MAEIYPLIFKPVLQEYIWGGRNLAKYGRELPEEGVIAESWEISGHEDGMTTIINGPYAGKTLQDLLLTLSEDLVGSNNRWALERGKFPLLVKLIDANQRLSIQVHPDDAYALENEGNELGKTEMWVVMDAKPSAGVICGFVEGITPEIIRQAIARGELEQYINIVSINRGDHLCVPSGTIHAILEGSVLVEIQQNSNTTYRLYDWNRLDVDGNLRPLQIEKALDVIDFSQINCALPQPEIVEDQELWVRERLCQNDYFTTERYMMKRSAHYSGFLDGSSLEIWGVLSGEAEIAGEMMSGVQFILLPAALGAFEITASKDSVLLRTYT